MAIAYPLSLPTATGIQGITLSGQSFVAKTTSVFTGQEQLQEHQGSFWHASIALPPMNRANAEEWIAFLLSLNGQLGTFLLRDPLGFTPRGSNLGSPDIEVDNPIWPLGQTGRTLSTQGWTPNETGVLLPGDYIEINAGTRRLYKVIQQVDSDGGGLADIELWPRLREIYQEGQDIITLGAQGTFRLVENLSRWSESRGAVYNISFNAREAF